VVLARTHGLARITSVADCLARFDEAMAGEVTVMEDAMAALRFDRDHVASTR